MEDKVKIREYLEQITKEKGYGVDDNEIVELLREGKSLKEYNRDEHRWYTLFHRVVKIGDVYIDFQDVHNSGDEPALDNKEVNEIILKSMKQVFPKEVKTIDYVD